MSYRSRLVVVVATAALASRDASLSANRVDTVSHTRSGTGNGRLEKDGEVAASFNRIYLSRWVSECPVGQSPKNLARCLKSLKSINETVDSSETVSEGMKDYSPNGCSITGETVRAVFYNEYSTNFKSPSWEVVCSVNLKPDAQYVRNKINELRKAARIKKVCASAILSTTASKMATGDSDSSEAASTRAAEEGYTYKKKGVVEIITYVEKDENSNARQVVDQLMEDWQQNDAFLDPAYRDIGFAWFPGRAGKKDVYVLEFGAPKTQNNIDTRSCKKR